MIPYCHLCHQGQPDKSPQKPQLLWLCVTMWWYSSCLRSLELSRKSNWWQVGSAVIFMVSNQESRVCLTYMYMEHIHRVYGVLCMHHVPVLDQIKNDNSYSTLWHHVVLYVYQKMEITETGLYKKHFQIFVRYISIILYMILPFCTLFLTCQFFVFPLINHSMFACHSRQVFLKFTGQTNIKCTGSSVHNHLCVINVFTLTLHSWHLLEEKPFGDVVEAIYYFFNMSWCTNTAVNNNIKGLW